jgi:2,4-dienoyl-CoA reductase-like NADH-dependent reductase (Old Yellow Enzyme family)
VSNSRLFSPVTLRSVTFRNRLWVSPMCQYSVEERDGVATDWHLVHLGSFARGGAGLVLAEATAVTPDGRITGWDLGLWNDEQRDVLARIVRFVRAQGAVAGIQLAHAGRKASTYREWSGSGTQPASEGGWQTVAPSAIPFDTLAVPRALDTEELDGIVQAFADAAARALDAGFEVLEIHAAHGYLLHQFLSPLSNTRTDEYGGSLENRARLLLRVVRAVRDVAGEDVPLFVRLSATDWADDGWDLDSTVRVAAYAREAGADHFDISTGGLVPGVRIPVGPGYQVPFAEAVRSRTGASVNAVGMIRSSDQAEDVLASGAADAVMIGREFLRDPHFALRAAHELGQHTDAWPPQYTRARWPEPRRSAERRTA